MVMARPKKSLEVDTVALLKLAAEREFAERGFSAARLEDVAAAVGISRPSLLYHFGSKEQLFRAVVQGIFADLGREFAGVFEGAGAFEERLYALLVTFSDFFERRPHAAGILIREVVSRDSIGRALLAELGGPLIEEVEAWVAAHGVVAAGVSVRGVLMHVVSDTLLRHGSGDLRGVFWGEEREPAAWPMVRALFLGGLNTGGQG